jgi:hypothetical protein
MSRNLSTRFPAALLLALMPAFAMAAPAAHVEFATGNVSAISATGQTRLLAKGYEIESGETINTHEGRVQLRFTDGAFVSLQPQTLYRIDEYRFDGKNDGSERGFFSLLKGGLRTITGLVGRTHKRNYQVNTTVATIGIRGTEYTLSFTGALTGSVGEGEIQVCNGGGCLPVTSGGSFAVGSDQIKPTLTDKKTQLPPAPPSTYTLPSYVAGDQTSSNGDVSGFVLAGTQTVSMANALDFSLPQDRVTGVFSAAGAASKVGGLTFPQLDEFASDFFMSWGRGLNTAGVYTHYVAGVPTLLTELDQLGRAGTVATYSLIAGTNPTADMFGATPFAVGTLTGGSLRADFGRGVVDTSLSMTFDATASTTAANGATTSTTTTVTRGGTVTSTTGLQPISQSVSINIQSSMLMSRVNTSSGFTASTFGPAQTPSGCTASVGSCTFNGMTGFFSGANAARAGVAYQVVASQLLPANCAITPCDVNGGNVKGVAVFSKQ